MDRYELPAITDYIRTYCHNDPHKFACMVEDLRSVKCKLADKIIHVLVPGLHEYVANVYNGSWTALITYYKTRPMM